MSGKVERSKRIRAVVGRSFDEHRLVRITRTLRGVDATDGVVVACGIRWLLVNRLSADLDLDGYTAVRWKHVKRAQLFDPGSLPARAAIGRPLSSVPAGVADATTTGSLLRSLETAFAPLAVHAETAKPSTRTVGVMSGIVGKSVRLEPVLPFDERDPRTVVLPFELISRVDFGTRYLAGLSRAIASSGE